MSTKSQRGRDHELTGLGVLVEEAATVDATAVLHPPRLRNEKRATEHTEIASISKLTYR